MIAASNIPESLDPALTRPGRFDRTIAVPLPVNPVSDPVTASESGTWPCGASDVRDAICLHGQRRCALCHPPSALQQAPAGAQGSAACAPVVCTIATPATWRRVPAGPNLCMPQALRGRAKIQQVQGNKVISRCWQTLIPVYCRMCGGAPRFWSTICPASRWRRGWTPCGSPAPPQVPAYAPCAAQAHGTCNQGAGSSGSGRSASDSSACQRPRQ